MTALLIVLVWLLPSLIAFRYTGYAANDWRLKHHGEFKRICGFCKCIRCGNTRHGHWNFESPWGRCKGDQRADSGWRGMHPFGIILGFIFAVLWPATLGYYGIKAGVKATGITRPQVHYFKPPPEIQSREERRVRREKEKDERLKELEKRNSELEKQLGIGHG